MQLFHGWLSETLSLNKSEILELAGFQKESDFVYFANDFTQELTRLESKIVQEISDPKSQLSRVTEWNNSPHTKLYNMLIGCCEVCPFCKEQCELVDPNHVSDHSIYLHRPECLGRYICDSDKTLSLKLCTESVDSDITFINNDTDGKSFPFKRYKEIYKNWYIQSDTKGSDDPLYWKWFVAEFYDKIQHWVDSSSTSIPSNWTMDKSVAVSSLKKIYQIS